jgi:magnesium-transporting ATPase (P-type)
VDGPTLTFALADLPDKFLALAQRCQSVICCRVTPLQKAKVVLLVKEKLGRVCLAVGDGANDVSMIQQAHVGVGIKGKEGTQAVRASDYALQEFRFLAPLICVHGRYSMLQMATLIQYSFYKNIVFIFPQFLFGIVSLFSAQIVYDQIIMTTFNIVWLSLPPLAMGIFERDVDKVTIMANPGLYSEFQHPGVFTARSMIQWLARAFGDGAAIFCIIAFGVIGHDQVFGNGQSGGFWLMATMASSCSITVILLKAGLEFNLWNVFTHLSIWLSLAGYYAFLALYMNAFIVDFNDDVYGVAVAMWSTPTFYLALALTAAVVLLPSMAYKYVMHWHFPRSWNILREQMRRRRRAVMPVELCGLDSVGLTSPHVHMDLSDSGGNLNRSAFM